MTKFFVFGDVLYFLIQGTGGGTLSQAKTRGAIVLVGLVVQMYVFDFFVKITVSFHPDLLQHPAVLRKCGEFRWKRCFVLLYMACACVRVRNLYRVVEYAMEKVSQDVIKSHITTGSLFKICCFVHAALLFLHNCASSLAAFHQSTTATTDTVPTSLVMSDPSTPVLIFLLGAALGAGTTLYLQSQYNWGRQFWPGYSPLLVHISNCNPVTVETQTYANTGRRRETRYGDIFIAEALQRGGYWDDDDVKPIP